jgi:hypothetical protein
MTNHYQHARNYHGNATKATKYIKPYRYKKSSLKSETTENEREPKNPRKHFVFLGHTNPQNNMTYFNCLHTAVTMVSLKAGYCSSTLCNTITGNFVGRNCTLLCKPTMCSSLMTVFL